MLRSIRSILRNKKGIAALEYAVLAGVIVIGVVAALSTTNLKSGIEGVFGNLVTAMNNASKTTSTPAS